MIFHQAVSSEPNGSFHGSTDRGGEQTGDYVKAVELYDLGVVPDDNDVESSTQMPY